MGWGIAHPVLLNDLYRYYGDRALLAEQYGTLVAYTEFLRSRATGHVIEKEISDHEMLGERPRALTATAFYFHDVRLTADLAHALGKAGDEKKYRALGREIGAAFNRKFLPDAKAGRFDAGNPARRSRCIWDWCPRRVSARRSKCLSTTS